MEVEVYQAILTVEKRKVRLTKSIAKQFPVRPAMDRWRAAEKGETQPAPICKVPGSALGHPFEWMYLIEDPVAGLAWVAAMQPRADFAKAIVDRGGWIDHPDDVPTVIIL